MDMKTNIHATSRGLAILLLAGAALLAGCGQPEGKQTTPPASRAPTNAHEMAVERDTDPVYRAELIAAGKVRNEKAMVLNAIREEMTKIEKAATNAPAAAYQDDPAWQKLKAEADQAQKAYDEAQSNVQKVIGERLKAQYAAMRAAGATGEAARPVMLPRPNPKDYNTNVVINAKEWLNKPVKVVPARPGTRAPLQGPATAPAPETVPATAPAIVPERMPEQAPAPAPAPAARDADRAQ